MKFTTFVFITILGLLDLGVARRIPIWARQGSLNSSDEAYCGNLTDPVFFTPGDYDDGGPGFILRDADCTNTAQPHYYFLYENSRDTRPWKYTLLSPGSEVFISVCPTFQGRLVRGNPGMNFDGTVNNLGTWVEMAWEAPQGDVAWGDVSLLEGCDGAATIAALDGSGSATGFSRDIITGAPPAVLTIKKDGSVAIAKTVGDGANIEAKEYELSLLSPTTEASIVNAYKPVIGSRNGRFNVTMHFGTY